MTLITSTDNPRFRFLLELAGSARARRRERLALIDGVHLVEAYRHRLGAPQQLIVSPGGRQRAEVAALLASLAGADCLEVSDGLLRRLSPVQTPTGVLAVVPIPDPGRPVATGEACVLLEDIQDPGNLGSILRSAAAAGIPRIYLSPACADPWSPKVLRAGMGAQFQLQCFAGTDLGGFAASYPGRLIATHRDAPRPVFEADLRGPVGLVFGNEGAGLSRGLLGAVAEVVSIPMPGGTESLNVAAAAAVCLFERVRQLG